MSVCEPSFCRLTRPMNWSGLPASCPRGTLWSVGGITASGRRWGGRDPDGGTVVVACISGTGRMTEDHGRTLDDFLYGIGE